jgi:hypothetical protein
VKTLEDIIRNASMNIRCCVCHKLIDANEDDGYSMQVTKFGAKSPFMIWAHGPCLRDAIRVVGEEPGNYSRAKEK